MTTVNIINPGTESRTWQDGRSVDELMGSYGWDGARARAEEEHRNTVDNGQWIDALRKPTRAPAIHHQVVPWQSRARSIQVRWIWSDLAIELA